MVLLAIVVISLLLLLAVVLVRREKSKVKVRQMTVQQKVSLLNELAGPFGFFYKWKQDIFSTCKDAWQRTFGYETLFDRTATAAHMVIDAWPVYFNYEGRTWMVEFWKGQYGICSGGEVGIYHANEIIPPHRYKSAHYDAAEDYEMPWIKCQMIRKGETLYENEGRHWWLTGFYAGMFSKPEQLQLWSSITFCSREMAEAFMEGLKQSGKAAEAYKIVGNSVHIHVDFEQKVTVLSKIHRMWAQFWNCCFVKLYRIVTVPFHKNADRILFLYFQLPKCMRFALHRNKKRYCIKTREKRWRPKGENNCKRRDKQCSAGRKNQHGVP